MKLIPILLRALVRLSVACLAACGTRITIGDAPSTKAPNAPTSAPPMTVPDGGVLGEAPGWEWLNPKPYARSFRGVHGTGENDVWLVGDHGSVFHWNGSALDKRYEGAASESFWAVWASANDDVWIAGANGGTGSRVLHWNGAAFEEDFTLTKTRVHAFWGAAKNDVWAAVDDQGRGAIVHWDGKEWSDPSRSPMDDLIRDFHGTSADDVIAVGRSGGLYRLRDRNAWSAWERMPITPDTDGVRADDARFDYVAVWASSPTDATAIFVRTGYIGSNDSDLGYAHFDGTSWRVVQAGYYDPANGLDTRNGYPLPLGPLRRGKLLSADARGSLTFAGIDSTPERGGTTVTTDGRLVPNWLGVGGRTATMMNGLYLVPGAALFAAEPYGGFGVDRKVGSGRFDDLLPNGGRDTLYDLAVRGDRVFAIANGRLVSWHDDRWNDVGAPFYLVTDVAFGDDGTLWVSGRAQGPERWQAGIARGDGKTFALTLLPLGGDPTFAAEEATSITSAGGATWVVATSISMSQPRFAVYRDVGRGFEPVTVPELAYVQNARISARGNDVWITLYDYHAKVNQALRWNGSAFERAGSFYPNAFASCCVGPMGGRAFLAASNDVWIPSQPALRISDGLLRPFAEGDYYVRGITGSSPSDVWLVGDGVPGGVIRHFDGERLTTPLSTTTKLYDAVRNDNGDIWVVGEGGTTLRLKNGGVR